MYGQEHMREMYALKSEFDPKRCWAGATCSAAGRGSRHENRRLHQAGPLHQRREARPGDETIIRDGRQSVLNPFDAHAVEAAVSIRDRLGGVITV
jgi:hypothetical protein